MVEQTTCAAGWMIVAFVTGPWQLCFILSYNCYQFGEGGGEDFKLFGGHEYYDVQHDIKSPQS